MQVTSSAFDNGGAIPKRHTGFGEDVSPELIVEGIPDEVKSLAVIMDDLDVPLLGVLNHWLMWNIVPQRAIPEALPAGGRIFDPISAVQGRAWGDGLYRGPKQPPFIRKAHRYRFTVLALDKMLALGPEGDKKALMREMEGHVVARAEIIGVYKPE